MKDKLKLTTNNELIIHPIEEKLYTREEVEKLRAIAFDAGRVIDQHDFETGDSYIEDNPL